MSTERESRVVWTPAATEAARASAAAPTTLAAATSAPQAASASPMSAVVAPPNVFPWRSIRRAGPGSRRRKAGAAGRADTFAER